MIYRTIERDIHKYKHPHEDNFNHVPQSYLRVVDRCFRGPTFTVTIDFRIFQPLLHRFRENHGGGMVSMLLSTQLYAACRPLLPVREPDELLWWR